jgi:shikimate dehydrogenase
MTGATELCPALTGSFSSPAGGNPTGAMVEAAYAHHGIAARYVNCEVAAVDLAAAVAGARAMGWIGFNCSIPHKRAIIDLIDEVAASATLIGAVNCVVEREGRWIGENTDGQGFLASLRTLRDPRGESVTILGAGGAARAIAVELALAGVASVHILNRDVEKADELAEVVGGIGTARVTVEGWAGLARLGSEATVVINATPVGLIPDSDFAPAVDLDTLRQGVVVCDVVPNPAFTSFLKLAEERGATTLDGRGMLTEQAAINIRLWTGVDPDRTVMRNSLDEAITGWRHPV